MSLYCPECDAPYEDEHEFWCPYFLENDDYLDDDGYNDEGYEDDTEDWVWEDEDEDEDEEGEE